MSPGPGTCGWRGGCILARRIPVLAQRRARRPRIFDEHDAFAEHLSRRMDGVSENRGLWRMDVGVSEHTEFMLSRQV